MNEKSAGHRIVVINPNSSETVTRAIHQTLAPLRFGDGPKIDCLTLAEGPPGIETQDHIDAVVDPLCQVIRQEEDRADAFVVACFGDPGLRLARKVTKKPVFGIGESAYLFSLTLGERFGVIAILPASVERQLESGEGQRFDVFAIDAFSSDAIPIHLLTRESFQTYLGHLNEDGVLAVHVTNRYIDLVPVVAHLAEVLDLSALYIENSGDDDRLVDSTDWILLTKNRAFLDIDAIHEDEELMWELGPLWTDDFSSVFEVIGFDD